MKFDHETNKINFFFWFFYRAMKITVAQIFVNPHVNMNW